MTSYTGDIILDTSFIFVAEEDLERLSGFHTTPTRHYYDEDDIEAIHEAFEEIKENLSEDNIHVETKEEALELAQLSSQDLGKKFNISKDSAYFDLNNLATYYMGCLILEVIEKKGHCEFYSDEF